MELYTKASGVLTLWDAEQRINGALYSPNIAWLYSDADLAALGLFRPIAAEPVPEGMRIVSTTAQLIDDVVKYVNVLEEAPIVFADITSAQALDALDEAGLLDAVAAIVDAHPVRSVQIWFNHANVWTRSHPYIAALAIELGLTDERVDELFRAAALKE